jgi:hypothetical protein
MYTVALLVLMGLVTSSVVALVTDLVPVVTKVPFVGNPDRLFVVAAILLAWLGDVSILGTFGLNAPQAWIDVVGSGLAIAGFASITNSVVSYIDRK